MSGQVDINSENRLDYLWVEAEKAYYTTLDRRNCNTHQVVDNDLHSCLFWQFIQELKTTVLQGAEKQYLEIEVITRQFINCRNNRMGLTCSES